jgi:hypothetical protein
VVQYVWRIAIAAGMLLVTELMALMMDARKDLPVDMGGVFLTWDLMRGGYEGIRGSVWLCILYCCFGSGGTIRGCPDQMGGLAGAFRLIWVVFRADNFVFVWVWLPGQRGADALIHRNFS